MNAITRPYTLRYPMLHHEPTLEPVQAGRKQHTKLVCACGWVGYVNVAPGKANHAMNEKYQDHLVEMMEARTR